MPYYLQSTKRRIGVADRHQTLAREIPAGTWVFGLSVPQNQRQLLRAMLARPPRQTPLDQRLPPDGARHRRTKHPRTRIYWLAMPVDAGRAGHSPVGQVAKLRDWVIGRDKDSDDSVAAYQRLAHDIITALPEEFGPVPVSAGHDRLVLAPQRLARRVQQPPAPAPQHLRPARQPPTLPVAVFDDGDQLHHGGRTLPLRLIAAGPGRRRRHRPPSPASWSRRPTASPWPR